MTSAISTYTESMYEAGGGKGGSLVDAGHGPSQGSTSESNKKGEPGASGQAAASTSGTQKAPHTSGAPSQKKPIAPLSGGASARPPGESSRGRDSSGDQTSLRGRDAGQGRSNKKGEPGAPGEAVKAGAGETAGYTFEDLLQQVQAVQSSVLVLPAIVLKDPAVKSALASLQAFRSSLQGAEGQAVKSIDSVPIVRSVFCKQLQSKLTLLAKALDPYKQAEAAKLNVAYLVTQLEATTSTSETQMVPGASGDLVIKKDVDDAKTKEAVQQKLYKEWTTEWKKSNRANKILKDVDDAKTRGDAQQKLYKDDAKGREEPKKEKAQEVAAEQKQQLEDQQKLYKDAVKKREEQQKEEAQEVAEERKELLEEALKRIAAKEAKKEEEEESAKHLRELTASCHFCP